MLLTLSVRNKDYKEWSGFFVTLVLHGEFNFFSFKIVFDSGGGKTQFSSSTRTFLSWGGAAMLI